MMSAPETVAPAAERLHNLLGYVEQVVRLDERPALRLSEHRLPTGQTFVLHQHELHAMPGVRHDLVDEDGPVWLAVERLRRSDPPAPPEQAADWRDLERRPLRAQWLREWLTAPPFTLAFVRGHEEFQALLAENDYGLLEKLLVWFQAQHTVPSPTILQSAAGMDSLDRLSLADRLGWPSDFEGWGRLLDWLLPIASVLPARLQPIVLEVFGVWQNVFADLQNPRSSSLIYVCSNWLVELESVEYPEKLTFKHGRWESLGSEARSRLATALRMIVMRAARSYPAPAIMLFERAASNDRMRREAYGDLMAFTPIMAEAAPAAVVAVAKAELIEELPQDRLDREEREYREHVEWLERLRAIPEQDRTAKQSLALQGPHFPIMGRNRIDLNDIGIDHHNSYYHPASPLHEPFASLFAQRPDVALALVRDLANHATKGWLQVQLLNRDSMGTPVPVILEFPWGKQEFWGDWHVYSWFLGHLAPNPLECAFLSLSYWAFKQLEADRPTDEVIRAVVEGSECYAVLGLALVLALETYETSETTFPIVTCQRLWHHDLARIVQEPTRDIDLFGFGFLSRLTGEKAKAKEFLDTRRSRKRDVRELAMQFALNADHGLRRRFKEALAHFPSDLPYEIEEARASGRTSASLKESAERWAGLGDIRNYRQHRTDADKTLIAYEPPVPLTPAQEKRLEESTATLREYSVIAWATKSLQENVLVDGLTLADAVAFAKARDNATILTERHEAGAHSAQTTITAVAAAVIRFGSAASADYQWAWDVMGRVAVMAEPEEAFSRSKIPWHPANHLVAALVHDRRSSSPRDNSVHLLLNLTLHPVHDVVRFAFAGLFVDPDEHVRWVAAQLAIDLSFHHRFEIKNGRRDDGADWKAREQSLVRARERLRKIDDAPLASIPPAWVKVSGKPRHSRSKEEAGWDEPNPLFDATYAAHLFPLFPVEAWCQSERYKPMLAAALKELVVWTAERLMPAWLQEKSRRRSDIDGSRLIEWNHVLGDLLARAAPFLETEFIRKELLAPFLTDDEAGLAVLAEFAERVVTRQVLDATTVPANTFDLLNDCVERAIRDPVFNRDNYRAGEVRGWDLPKLIRALLFVPLDKEAPGAARFANGDWSQVSMVIPLVTRLVAATGWSPYVMQQFLTLCERAGSAYPVDEFAVQANTVLNSLANSKNAWTGTTLPARTAATVQRLAYANFPLDADPARSLLRILDALIDLGDRRSAALEQDEAFRGVQVV